MYRNNSEWEQDAKYTLGNIVTKFLDRKRLSHEEREIMQMVFAEIGTPPNERNGCDDETDEPLMTQFMFNVSEREYRDAIKGAGNSGTR